MRRSKELLHELRRVAERNLFTLTCEEIFGNSAVGIDSINKKLVHKSHGRSVVIDLTDINACSINVILRNIQAGDLDNNKVEDYIVRISLRLFNENDSKPFEITFYDYTENEIFELPIVRQKALKCKQTISALLSHPVETGGNQNTATLYTT